MRLWWLGIIGSSPLARGLHHIPCIQVRSGWIIPARAGFTTDYATSAVDTKDHPRSRGVYLECI